MEAFLNLTVFNLSKKILAAFLKLRATLKAPAGARQKSSFSERLLELFRELVRSTQEERRLIGKACAELSSLSRDGTVPKRFMNDRFLSEYGLKLVKARSEAEPSPEGFRREVLTELRDPGARLFYVRSAR